ncbi:hypothetical protein [Sulfurovum sp.]|uniref:hypothetical protein n=1 Tax=Sulfurovum sp. TaxID=1969726 RepID=UPI002867C02C|nr:hypothetical protein [Sulfurovum sp.]
MHIAFKFKYIHTNGLFTRLLNRIGELTAPPVSTDQGGVYYSLGASGDRNNLGSE